MSGLTDFTLREIFNGHNIKHDNKRRTCKRLGVTGNVQTSTFGIKGTSKPPTQHVELHF